MKPLVSIVVPIYKVPENYLRQCIESCINQSLKEIEIILVDDGSPDDCGIICDEYANKDNRIKVIHKQNEGLSAARNSGRDQVTGETMMFLDGDDFLDLEACETAYSAMKKQNAQIVLFDFNLIYPSSVKPSEVCFKEPKMYSSNLECRELQAGIIDFNGWIGGVWGKLVSTEFIFSNNVKHVSELKHGIEGLVYNILLFEKIERAYHIHIPLYNYVYNNDSITHTPNIETNLLSIKGFEFLKEYGETHPVSESFHKNLMTRVLYAIITAAISGVFNPYNKMAYREQKRWFSDYLSIPLVKEALQKGNRKTLNKQRRIVIFLIENRFYWALYILGTLRRLQLKNK